jgi:hypothetical protein
MTHFSVELVQNPRRATRLHVCFGFDKSPQNFTIRKSRRISHEFLCPSSLPFISYLAPALNVTDTASIGASTLASTTATYLTSTDGIQTMRATCLGSRTFLTRECQTDCRPLASRYRQQPQPLPISPPLTGFRLCDRPTASKHDRYLSDLL